MSPSDFLINQLADAPLSAKHQIVWKEVCAELIQLRQRVQELETRLKVLENRPDDEDDLQSILTRPEFNREVARMLAFDERYGGLSSVLYFDVEDLDALAAGQGKEMMEKAVRCISDALMTNIRRTDILGRLATDEFGVLLPRCDNQNAWKKGELLAGAIYESLEKMPNLEKRPSVTYGAYTFREKESLSVGLREAACSVTKLEIRE